MVAEAVLDLHLLGDEDRDVGGDFVQHVWCHASHVGGWGDFLESYGPRGAERVTHPTPVWRSETPSHEVEVAVTVMIRGAGPA